MELIQKDLTDKIIACAIAVHKVLGPGFLESIYKNALSIELSEAGLKHATEVQVDIFYKGKFIGRHRLDIIVVGRVAVELKTADAIHPVHLAILRSYLKATGLRVGLALNFAKPVLEVRRVVL